MPKTNKDIPIHTDYITLGQLLKLAGVIGEGWEAKRFLADEKVLVNGEEEKRRGKKLRRGDKVELLGLSITITD